MKTHNHRRPRCARLFHTKSLIEATRYGLSTYDVRSVRCLRREGHDGAHRWPVDRRRPIP